MDQYLVFAMIGLGVGCLYAAIGIGVIVTYRGTGVINFATGATAMWGTYVYAELRSTGDLVLPVVGIPHRVALAGPTSFWPAFVLGVGSCALIGLLVHLLVFRPLRRAPVLAKVVASVGVLLFFQSLTALQFGTTSRPVSPIVPSASVSSGGVTFPQDRLWLTLVVVVVTVLVAAYFRCTRQGLATVAAAENERTASLAGYSPQRLAAATWVLSGVVVGAIGILVAPTTVLNPSTYALAIVPALAAVLVAQFRSIAVTAMAALALGSFQSIVTFQASQPYWPGWAVTGLPDAVPFVIIVVALFWLGDRLPTRGAVETARLPEVVRTRPRPAAVAALTTLGAAAIVVTSGTYRFGVITTMIASIIMLSLVVLTGFVGQISLAQASLAGIAGFALSKLTTDVGVPFPLSLALSSSVAALFGVVIGIPALRIRGAQLAVVTLAGGVALEKFVFRNPAFTSSSGNPIAKPVLFGLDVSIRSGRNVARWQFGFVVLAVLLATALVVGNLAVSATGRRLLAVRSNERAAAGAGIDVAQTKLVAFGIASFIAGLGGSLIGYSRGQLSADSFTALVGLTLLAFAYLGGISSVAGALVAGTLAPLGIGYVILDRLFDMGNSYGVFAGFTLVLTAILNQDGIVGAMRGTIGARRRIVPPAAVPEAAAGLPDLAPLPAGRRRSRACGSLRRDADVVFDAKGVTVRFGGVVANDDIDVRVHRGEIVGLIGPNGAGKTTFIDAVTGFVPAAGELSFMGRDISALAPHQRARSGLVRTWQSVELFGDLTVGENLAVMLDRSAASDVLRDLFRPCRRSDADRVAAVLGLLGLTDHADRSPGDLSLGEQKLVGVARSLASAPELIMLDEPAAGLDSTESRHFGDRLLDVADTGVAVILIDHDMGLVLDVCDYIYVLDFGRLIAEGTADDIRRDPVVITAYLGAEVTV